MFDFFKSKNKKEEVPSDENQGLSWASRLKEGLSKSSNKINEGLKNILIRKKLDQQTLDEIEELLIASDMGTNVATLIISEIRKNKFDKDISEEEIKESIAQIIINILKPVARELNISENKPHVLFVCGVNGSGKTTTIGKLAKQWQDMGKKITIAACDTFRAAAVEQLEVWAKRANCGFIKGDLNADPASVAYSAFEQAKANNSDILIIDTAGRLQNKHNLMEQLHKIIKVIKKIDASAPHNTLIVLDATTGQNAVSQVKTFKEIVDINGIIITKLDGTAKGGVLVSIAQQFGLPIHAIGIGEAIGDLKPFTAEEFAKNLLG